jgi:hypothetical protein
MELPAETVKFMNEIKEVFQKRFPESSIGVHFSNHLQPNIEVRFYLSKNSSECSNNILMNDCCRTIFMSFDVGNDGTLFDKVSFERIYGKGIIRAIDKNNPDEKYLAYGSVPVKFRKLNNKPAKVVEGFKKYVDTLAITILENAEAINNGIIRGLYDVRNKVK